jgi:hypothetical protein
MRKRGAGVESGRCQMLGSGLDRSAQYFIAFQCRGFGIFNQDPDFYPSRISDPGSNNRKKKEGGKYLLSYLCVATNITELKITELFLNMLR